MSWTDKQSVRVMKYLRDKYEIKDFVETGTHVGINAKLHSKNFDRVLSCEKITEYYDKAQRRLKDCPNVYVVQQDSSYFLKNIVQSIKNNPPDIPAQIQTPLFYLDAHFYDPKMPSGKGKFVVLHELKALKGLENCVISIHDFCNNLGGINYNGMKLDFDLMEEDLKNINPSFHYYTNTLESCDIVQLDHSDIKAAGLEVDNDVLSNLEYAWTKPDKTYRGLLYALPTELTKKEMDGLGLVKWGKIK